MTSEYQLANQIPLADRIKLRYQQQGLVRNEPFGLEQSEKNW